MAPGITYPAQSQAIEYLFNISTTISCIFIARPAVGNEAVTWYKDGNAVELSDFYQTGTNIDGVFPYGMTEGFRSDLEFTHDGPYTCSDVSVFDGKYQCEVISNSRTDISANMSMMALCTFPIIQTFCEYKKRC